jgi:short subunit dehydrogenase-like uncharacterized protein
MSWLIYGANGYTGTLIAREAVRRGMQPVLAGRSEAPVRALAAELGLECRTFGLTDTEALSRALADQSLVLHCAGPFSQTAEPMIEACIRAGIHYLDITGEISVFEYANSRSEAARKADVALVPGVGFDVVPTDCLAATLVRSLPAATHLQLAFEAGGGPSPGTAKTSVEGLAKGGRVRRDGQMKTVPLAWKTRRIPFAHGDRTGVTIPWGDVFTAYVTTGIPNIEVYLSVPPATAARLRRMRWFQPLLGLSFVQKLLKRQVERRVSGPSAQRRESTDSQLWGLVESADGRTVEATMTTPNGYDLTVDSALGVVAYLLDNGVEGGYYTPALLMGADYAASLSGVKLRIGA